MTKPKKKKNAAVVAKPEPPPTEPTDRKQLERAKVLLGNVARGDNLSPKLRAELIALVGGYPKPATAANWKLALVKVSDDEIWGRAV